MLRLRRIPKDWFSHPKMNREETQAHSIEHNVTSLLKGKTSSLKLHSQLL
jgi:hypothetical protein